MLRSRPNFQQPSLLGVEVWDEEFLQDTAGDLEISTTAGLVFQTQIPVPHSFHSLLIAPIPRLMVYTVYWILSNKFMGATTF